MNGRVVLGVTGSIAAYKSAELVRLLTKAGIDVWAVMTRSGAEFLGPATLATLTGHPVTIDMFGGPEGTAVSYGNDAAEAPDAAGAASNVEHIRASRSADLIIVAPATANVLAKVAHGLADDALTTTILASSVPVLFAPAMNTRMWENPATRANLRLLAERGYRFADPGAGDLACGEYGAGRMAEPEEIAGLVIRALLLQRPEAPSLLVTTGGTEEPIDPVRVLANRSSGRMGFAVAEAARDRGYRVTVIAGRTSAPPPYGVEIVRASSVAEMGHALERLHLAHDLLVMAAAVADYRPKRPSTRKIDSGHPGMTLELAPNPDLVAGLARKRAGRVTIGFALQTGGTAAEQTRAARAKLERKGLDLIVLNDPTRAGIEFGGDENEVTFVSPAGTEDVPRASKREIGERLLDRAEQIWRAKVAAGRKTPGDAKATGDGTSKPLRKAKGNGSSKPMRQAKGEGLNSPARRPKGDAVGKGMPRSPGRSAARGTSGRGGA